MRCGKQVPSALRAAAALALLLPGPVLGLRPLPGWPREVKVSSAYPPCGIAAADLDGDGSPEVAVGSTAGRVYVFDAEGGLLPGWPVSTGGRVQAKPAAADVDGDGSLDLVVLDGETGLLWALDGEGSSLPGWPVEVGAASGVIGPSITFDDSVGLSVITPCREGIECLDSEGRRVWTSPLIGSVTASPAVSGRFGLVAAVTEYGFLYLQRNGDGQPIEGFPFLAGQRSSWGAPVIADLEPDGSPEVLFTAYDIGQSVSVYSLEDDGGISPGFPVRLPGYLSYSSPVVADADGDGDMEVFLCCSGGEGTLWAMDHTGEVLPGWPAAPSVQMEGSPVVADLDADGSCEVLAASGSAAGGLFCYGLRGDSLGRYTEWGTGPARTDSPVAADLDGDGAPELLLLTAAGTLYAWTGAEAGGALPWPQLYRDRRNTSSTAGLP